MPNGLGIYIAQLRCFVCYLDIPDSESVYFFLFNSCSARAKLYVYFMRVQAISKSCRCTVLPWRAMHEGLKWVTKKTWVRIILMLRQKDHSANAEHCDTGTPEIRIHIPAGTGRSTVTVEIYMYQPQSPNPRQICTCIHVCMHRDPAVMRADAWNHISHRTSANAVQIS